MTDDPDTLVSTRWLASRLSEPDLRVLDASWYMPDADRDPRAEYDVAHIPGARFVALDDVSDPNSALPHMEPAPDRFVSRMRRAGVADGMQVVIYDGAGIFSAARLWWLFRRFGLRAAVLDGGFPLWRAEGRPVSAAPVTGRDRHLTGAKRVAGVIRDVTDVARAVKLGTAQIVDARAAPRFHGDAAEPRPGLRAGHIPGSLNVPYPKLLRADGTMKDGAELAQAFIAGEVDLKKPVITSCGSGVTAAILNLGLARLGHPDHSLYDGSWAEWGAYPDLRIERG